MTGTASPSPARDRIRDRVSLLVQARARTGQTRDMRNDVFMLDGVAVPMDALFDQVAAIAEMCGIETARALVDEFGGAKIWVPKRWRDSHLLNALGEDAARRIHDAFGGESLEIPREMFPPAGLRTMIRHLDRLGVPRQLAALWLRCSHRTVRDELRNAGPRDRSRSRESARIKGGVR